MIARMLGNSVLVRRLAGCAALALSALPAWAQEDGPVVDARLQGYAQNVVLSGGSTALTWLLLIFLTIVAVGVMFKDAKRTHLD